MASQKEEPNSSFLFGDSTGDDPFSQLQQQNSVLETVPVKQETNPGTNADEQAKNVASDASSLFGNQNATGNADLFFSSTVATANTTPQYVNSTSTLNASAASFFEQPQASSSFFDGLGQNAAPSLTQSYSHDQQSTEPTAAASLTQAYDPNNYTSYDYNQSQVVAEGEQQQYDQSQYIQFDPNVHYYYDEQGQVHYYDPNTNQEYDMTGYDFGQQGQTYDYQYDPQYAEYYAQQGYDTSAYTATAAGTETDQQQAYTTGIGQDNYDPNAYAPSTLNQTSTLPSSTAAIDPSYYKSNTSQDQVSYDQSNYDPQAYAATATNTVAEVPAQVQSEQTIDTQHYLPEQQQQQDQYGIQNYAPVDASAEFDQLQQQTYNYQSYEATSTTDFQQQQEPQQEQTQYDYTNGQYSELQAEFEAEDLQQQPIQAIPVTRDVAPPPSAPPKNAALPQKAASPAPPPSSTIHPPPRSNIISPALPQELGSETASVTKDEQEEQDLNDLDDLVLGDANQKQASDEFDLLISTTTTTEKLGYTTTSTEPVLVHNDDHKAPEQSEPIVSSSELPKTVESDEKKPIELDTAIHSEQNAPISEESVLNFEPEEQKPESFLSEQSKEPEQVAIESQQAEQALENVLSYEPTSQPKQTHEPQQSYEPTSSYEPQQSYEPVSSYEPQQSYEPVSSYEPQQSYEPVSSYESTASYEPIASYEPTASYEPIATYESIATYEPTGSYEPQQSYEHTASYEHTTSFEPTAGYEIQQSHEPTSNAEPQQNYEPIAAYEPQQSYEPTTGFEPQQSYKPSTGYEPQQSYVPTSSVELQQSYEPSTGFESQQQFISSPPPPPPRAVSIKSISSPPPPPPPQTFPQQQLSKRANSITEPDRRQNNASPFTAGYYANTAIERSATVPPPMTERIASPRPQLIPCPDPQCEGENKVKAKFCCECGRPLAGISRSTTPAANLSPGVCNTMQEGFTPMTFGTIRTALDEKKDAMVQSLKQFVANSSIVHSELEVQEKRRRILEYVDSQLSGPLAQDESKALLWRVAKLMIEHYENTLGDGGELDKSIIALIATAQEEPTTNLDKLESFLFQGDREGACQFAAENDMWAHALVITSSLETDLFKCMITQFIHRELFSSNTQLIPQIPADKKALRMLYSVFNGAGADAVSEFVKITPEQEAVYTQASLEGWKDALALILANRSKKDQDAICSLGDQLNQLNATNEAYLCYLLSPDTLGLGSSKLLGHNKYSDLDALYLLELYEFALESKATIQQDYKLILAWWLTDLGFAEESQKYIDSIVQVLGMTSSTTNTVDQLKQVNSDLSSYTSSESENVTSLLSNQSFDTLISSIQEKVSSQTNKGHDFGYSDQGYGQTADYTGQQSEGYNYGYGYGAGYTTESADASATITSPFSANKGIQSPFQTSSKPVQAVSSPFGASQPPQAVSSPFGASQPPQAVSSPFGASQPPQAVRSPFGAAQPTDTSYTPDSGAWWGSDNSDQIQASYEPEIQTTTTSYQPDAYTPVVTEATDKPAGTRAAWEDDDDDLGFGNSKKKPATTTETDNSKTTDSTQEQKPNQVTKEETKEKAQSEKAGGWGIFSIFGRKEKDPNMDEKKAVKANLGEQSSFYYDEKEKRWVNKLNDTKPAAATPPPPPKASTPQPSTAAPMAPPMGGLKPNSMPPPRVNSAPVAATAGGPPIAAPLGFNTPPATSRKGGKKSMRSRYVDVLNTN